MTTGLRVSLLLFLTACSLFIAVSSNCELEPVEEHFEFRYPAGNAGDSTCVIRDSGASGAYCRNSGISCVSRTIPHFNSQDGDWNAVLTYCKPSAYSKEEDASLTYSSSMGTGCNIAEGSTINYVRIKPTECTCRQMDNYYHN